MPKISIYKYFVFFIVAYDLLEGCHLHIVKTKKGYTNAAKLWLDPVEIFKKGDLTEKELNTVVKLITKMKSNKKANL
jgi:hypothetical protein